MDKEMTGPRRFSRVQTTLFFDPKAEPIAEVANGERFIVETADSVCGLVKAEVNRGFHIDEVLARVGGACPVTGPFAVRGARTTDVIEIEIHQVNPWPSEGEAWTGIFGGFGALTHEAYSLDRPLAPEIRLIPYRHGVAFFPRPSGPVEIRLQPFIGTMGVAPRWERRMSFSQSPEYLGDVDIPAIAPGSKVVLPVNVDGALFSLGDIHGAQGDGEITGAAIELEGEVELTVRVRPRDEVGYVSLPQVNTENYIGSIAGFHGVHLGDCARAAYTDLVRRLVRAYHFTEKEAYLLLGQVGRLQIGNMIDPFYSVLASIDRKFI